MKRALFLVAVVFSAISASAEDFTVRVQEQLTIEVEGATAAYVVDPAIADAVLGPAGKIVVTGRSVGSTELIAVTPAATRAFSIAVTPAAVLRSRAAPAPSRPPAAIYDTRYGSDAGQLVNAFDVFMRDEERLSQIHLINVHYFRDHFGGSATAFPSVFYRITTPRRRITFLDEFVDVSPLTLQYAQVRGFHLTESSGLELHAGFAAPSMYEGVFLPIDRRWVAGAGYAFRAGRWRFIPSVYGFFSEPPNTLARRGVVTSLISEYTSDTFWGRAEIGEGNSAAGGSAQFRYHSERQQATGRLVVKPDDFPSLGIIDLRGVHGDANWNARATRRLTLSGFASYDRFNLFFGPSRTAVGHFDFRYRFTDHWSFLGGLYGSEFRTRTQSINTVEVPAGLGFDSPRFGADVIYRTISATGASRRGDALRADIRAGGPLFQVSAWGERQREAPTLDLIFRQDPELETALLRLGISVRNPEDLARVLRDNPLLIDLGFIEGVNVNLAPKHTMGGIDVAWSPMSGRDRLFLNSLYDRVEGVAFAQTTELATLGISHRIFGLTELYGTVTRWRSETAGVTAQHSSYEVGLRANIGRIPSLFSRGGAIEGVVFLDPEMRGTFTGSATPIEGLVVALDGVESAQTDRNGRFVFRGVAAGTHQVSAILPASKAAFFTTASTVDVTPPSHVDFGLVWSPARLSGRVASDADAGVAGVAIVVSAGNRPPVRLTTDSGGGFRVDLPPGDYLVDLATESLPAGYVAADGLEHAAHLVADQPVHIVFPVSALRSISGIAAPGAHIELLPVGRTTTADASGNFTLRSLPAGTFKIVARSGGSAAEKMVVLPEAPASMHDINLMSGGSAPPQRMMAASATGDFVVQAGAFREPSNAESVIERLRRLGIDAFTASSHGLTLVRVGPFATRQAAAETMQRLRNAGIDALVTPIR